MKKKILVAGGTGYIGSHTTVELQNAGYEVVIIDDLSNSNIEVLDGIEKITGIRPEFIQLDLKDKEGTRKALEAHPGIKGIILFAASKAVGESVQQPLKYYRNNIVTLVNLLEMMPEFNIEGIVFSSSCTVYGQPDPENLPVTENAPIKPAMSPYGNTKTDQRGDYPGYDPCGSAFQEYHLALLQPDRRSPKRRDRRVAEWCSPELDPVLDTDGYGYPQGIKRIRR